MLRFRTAVLGQILLLILVTFSLTMAASSIAYTQARQPTLPGPVAFIGHGAMFDSDGNELTPSLSLIEEAQNAYLPLLVDQLDEAQRQRFRQLETQLSEGLGLQGQSRLVLNSRLIQWLLQTVRPLPSERLLGINNLMKLELRDQLPAASSEGRIRPAAPFAVPDELQRRLRDAGLAEGVPAAPSLARSTTAGGEAYRALCRDNGVPIPPDWGTGGWVPRGELTTEFISAGLQAEVFTFQSTSPEGMCIALPRFRGDEIRLLGVICLGKPSGRACFWDNQTGGGQFFPRRGEIVPFEQFGGGAELVDDVGGVCTECHAGENPYVIHPGTALGLPALDGLPLFADAWHFPLVKPGWPENPGPLTSPGICATCHVAGGPGGRFPDLSTVFQLGFCGTILRQAIARTMPPGAPGSLAGDPHPIALLDRCKQDPQEPPLRGEGLFVRTDGNGNIATIRQHLDWDRDWTLIVPGEFGGDGYTDLLFYKRSTGEGLLVTTDGIGNIPTLRQHTDWDRDWDVIIPGEFGGDGHADLLFYKRSTGEGLFVITDGNGNIAILRQHTDWDRDWDVIVPGNFGGDGHTDLLFYKRSTGEGLFVATDGSGGMSALRQHTDWDRDWDQIIPGHFGGDGYTDLLFYKRSTGIGLFVTTDGTGSVTDLRQHNDWDRDWDMIVPGTFGGDGHTDLLFHKRALGVGLFAFTNGSGEVALVRQHTDWDRDWDLIVPGKFADGAFSDLLFQK